MVEINHKIVIAGVICLTIVESMMIYMGKDNDVITTTIIGLIGLAVGVIIPTPKINSKRGVLIW